MGGFSAFARRVKGMKPSRAVVPHRQSRNVNYPDSAELALCEAVNKELLGTAKELLLAAFPKADYEADSADDLAFVSCEPSGVFLREVDRAADRVNGFQAERLAGWSMMAIGERYLADKGTERRKAIMARWAAEFAELCRSVKREMRERVAAELYAGYGSGRTVRKVAEGLRAMLKEGCAHRAELIARTETGKLNARINEAQAEDAGMEYYEWGAAMDGRTRPTHAAMDGRFCRYGEPDTWYSYESGRMVRHLREPATECFHGMPGEDFQCRCTALPYFPELEADYSRPETSLGVAQGNPFHVEPTGRRTLSEMVEAANEA